MRLTIEEVNTIKETIGQHIQDAKIYLFGSRITNEKKGGDIDIYIVAKQTSYELKIKLKSKLKYLLHKPIDIVFHKDFEREIEKEALKGILL